MRWSSHICHATKPTSSLAFKVLKKQVSPFQALVLEMAYECYSWSSIARDHSSLASLLPKVYARPPLTMFAAQRPSVRPLIAPLAPNLLEKACFLLLATTKYAALQAEVTPAESTGKPFRFRYEEKRRTGTKSMGSFWKGRKCWAVMRVARAVGGTEDSSGSEG